MRAGPGGGLLRARIRAGYFRRSPSRCGTRARRADRRRTSAGRRGPRCGRGVHAGCSWSLPLGRQERRDQVSGPAPFPFFVGEALPARGAQRVELRAPVVFRLAPFGRDEPFLLELQEGGVERAVVEFEAVAAGLFDAARDAVPVQGAESL